MQSPVQVVSLLRPKTRNDLLLAAAFSSLVFTATPFLLPAVAEQYDVSLGWASLISSAQLLGFVAGSWTVGRVVDPSVRLLVGALLVAGICNALSAAAPWFSVLLALRLTGGVALSVLAWLGWQEVFGDTDRMGDVAVVGPVVGIVGAPLASAVANASGADAVFVMLGAIALLPLPFVSWRRPLQSNAPRKAQRSKPIPVTRIVLAALAALTLGGSAVFVFGVALGTDRAGLDPFVLSLAFSANALVGIPAARYRGARRLSGLWLLGTAVGAVVITTVTVGWVFLIAIVGWGFCFWAGVPGAFVLLAERSANPADRAGDAQSVMAAGRVVGPLVGGALVEAGALTALGLVAAGLIALAALTLVVVEVRVPPLVRS